MGGTFTSEMKCTEAEEAITTSSENFLQLSCFISQDVKYMMTGLKNVRKIFAYFFKLSLVHRGCHMLFEFCCISTFSGFDFFCALCKLR